MSFRVGLLGGTLAALIAALPAALRVVDSLPTWVVLAGAGALVLGPLAGGIRNLSRLGLPARSLLWGLALASLPVAALATRVQVATHHRPLGATAFALAAACLILAGSVLSARVLSWSEGKPPPAHARSIRRAFAGLAALGPLLLVIRALGHAPARIAVFDVCLAIGLCCVLGLVRWPEQVCRTAGKLAIPLWATLVSVAALLALGATPSAVVASPVLYAPLSWLAP
ncbi:MAG TPA: hypothetical protein VER33_18140 [Polyangiaceae bacterium]|nr:hypothetical protein [Polyangiaceae bacterium]